MFDHPVFAGRITTKSGHMKTDATSQFRATTTFGSKRHPNEEFLLEHHLNENSLPVEFVEAFFPMCNNKELNKNGEPHSSMEHLAKNTNTRATLTFAGEATCDHQWSGPFSVKEL